MTIAAWLLFIMTAACYAQEDPKQTLPGIVRLSQKSKLAISITTMLINERCEKYRTLELEGVLENMFDPLVKSRCEKISRELFEVLDFSIIKLENGVAFRAIFTKKLIQLISNPKTSDLLAELRNKIESDQSFNVYHWLLSKRMNAFEAAEWLAILFQDTNGLSHIYYLQEIAKTQKWPNYSAKYHALANLQFINEVFQGYSVNYQYGIKDTVQLVELYPSTSNLNPLKFQPAMYHFYTPAYLSIELKRRGNDNYDAFVAPFFLRLLYEIIFDGGQSDLTDINTYLVALGEKEPAIKSSYKRFDLYLSYIGSYWAIGKNPPLNWEAFSRNANFDMSQTIRLMTKEL